MDAACWVIWGEGIETQYSTGLLEDLLPCITYFHLFLLSVLVFGLWILLLLVSLDIDPVLFVLDLHMKYTVEVFPQCTYIVWFVISCDSNRICKKRWSCLCIHLHSWWRFGMLCGLWYFFTPKVFSFIQVWTGHGRYQRFISWISLKLRIIFWSRVEGCRLWTHNGAHTESYLHQLRIIFGRRVGCVWCGLVIVDIDHAHHQL